MIKESMAGHSFPAVVVVVAVLVSCLLAPPAATASSGNTSTYWGTNDNEFSVEDVCNTGQYSIVNIGFVYKFGNGQNPVLNLGNHCHPNLGGCTYLGREIRDCQQKGIKVLISIGGPTGDYNLTSQDDVTRLANYLWNNYLGGSTLDRPFGDEAILDGVDFFIEESTTEYWDVLVETLRNLSNNGTTQIELSATAKCHYPDKYLRAAIQTGLFDYVQVRFFNETCCSLDSMKSEWDEWIADDKVYKLLVGLITSREEECDVDLFLINKFLKYAMNSTKYGGVMVWFLYPDHDSGYSETSKQWNSVIQTTTSSRVVS